MSFQVRGHTYTWVMKVIGTYTKQPNYDFLHWDRHTHINDVIVPWPDMDLTDFHHPTMHKKDMPDTTLKVWFEMVESFARCTKWLLVKIAGHPFTHFQPCAMVWMGRKGFNHQNSMGAVVVGDGGTRTPGSKFWGGRHPRNHDFLRTYQNF